MSKHVSPSNFNKRWEPGKLKMCDQCGVLYEWTEKNFYRRYKSDEVAAEKGYVPNLQPHCKSCTAKSMEESRQRRIRGLHGDG